MKTKIRKSSKLKKQESILKNSNFLNSQNYVISNFKKKFFINNFLILKYLSIVSNRVIGTVILSIIFFILYLGDFFHFKIILHSFLFLFAVTLSFGIVLLIPIIFISVLKNKKININKKVKIFEITSPILSFKNIFIENKNGKFNLFKKIISFLIIVGLGLIIGIFVFVFFDSIINFIVSGKLFSNTSNSYISFLLLPLILGSIIYFYIKIFDFISRIRILPILLFPIFIVIYLINFVYRLFKKSLGYNLFVNKIGFSNKIYFTKLNNFGAENKFIKIIKK